MGNGSPFYSVICRLIGELFVNNKRSVLRVKCFCLIKSFPQSRNYEKIMERQFRRGLDWDN